MAQLEYVDDAYLIGYSNALTRLELVQIVEKMLEKESELALIRQELRRRAAQ